MPLSSPLSRLRATLTTVPFVGGRVAGKLVAAWIVFGALLGGYWLQLDHSHATLVSQAESLTRLRALQTGPRELDTLFPEVTAEPSTWYLVDPAGWVMMTYNADISYKEVIADLKFLLKNSGG